jgi:hypothetical protein
MGRQLALDGHDVPVLRPVRPIRFPTGPGHTQDFEVTLTAAGDYAVDVQRFGYTSGVGVTTGPVTTVPLRARER